MTRAPGLRPPLEYETEADAIEDYFDRGFTDGLPIIPPTPERVEAMLATVGLNPDEILGEVPTRSIVARADTVAVNAVMAGCLPEYFPVVVAAVRAHLAEKGNSHSTTATLAGAAHAVIVNGPIRDRIDVRSGQACFGPGFRANATIGRALRLVIRNVCNSVPGVLDRASFSWPLRYSFCFGENEEGSDWVPLHVQRGFRPTDSVVTVHSVNHAFSTLESDPDPDVIVESIACTARHRGIVEDQWCGEGRGVVVVLGPEHQRRFVADGWDKQRVQQRLWERLNAPTTARFDKQVGLAGPDNVLIVAAGGPGLAVSWTLLPHLSNPMSELVIGADR